MLLDADGRTAYEVGGIEEEPEQRGLGASFVWSCDRLLQHRARGLATRVDFARAFEEVQQVVAPRGLEASHGVRQEPLRGDPTLVSDANRHYRSIGRRQTIL